MQAFDAYLVVLNKLVARFTLAMRSEEEDATPLRLAAQINERYEKTGKGAPVTNNGMHWTDWIPQAVKDAVAAKFPPPKKQAREFVPFSRVLPVLVFEAKRARLLKTTTLEIDRLEGRRRVLSASLKGTPTPVQIRRVNDELAELDACIDTAKQAKYNLEHWKRTDLEMLPNTWHGAINRNAPQEGKAPSKQAKPPKQRATSHTHTPKQPPDSSEQPLSTEDWLAQMTGASA